MRARVRSLSEGSSTPAREPLLRRGGHVYQKEGQVAGERGSGCRVKLQG